MFSLVSVRRLVFHSTFLVSEVSFDHFVQKAELQTIHDRQVPQNKISSDND